MIQQGENQAVEFKGCQVHADSLAREMTAFSNSSGGDILIGVDAGGNIEGVSTGRDWEEWVANIARNNVAPAIRPLFQKVEVEGKTVVCDYGIVSTFLKYILYCV